MGIATDYRFAIDSAIQKISLQSSKSGCNRKSRYKGLREDFVVGRGPFFETFLSWVGLIKVRVCTQFSVRFLLTESAQPPWLWDFPETQKKKRDWEQSGLHVRLLPGLSSVPFLICVPQEKLMNWLLIPRQGISPSTWISWTLLDKRDGNAVCVSLPPYSRQ